MIDWESSETHVLLNPRVDPAEKTFLCKELPRKGKYKAHIWLLTSGTTSTSNRQKYVALRKEAILSSASSVNRHLKSGSFDVWLNPLPHFHVGGLGIMARSYLSGAKSIALPGKWDPILFYNSLSEQKVTLTALVPTQLHDLVSRLLPSPNHLRAVIVGGDRLDDGLFHRAIALGWKVLRSYGLTEASSQVATALSYNEDSALQTLDHVNVRIDQGGYIALKGPSLLTCYAFRVGEVLEFSDPKRDGWFLTEDRGLLEGSFLSVLGRGSDFVKVGGESVCLSVLNKKFEELKMQHQSSQTTVLLPIPDERLGAAILLAVEGSLETATRAALDCFQLQVLPFERIQRVCEQPILPRTALGKICKNAILKSMS